MTKPTDLADALCYECQLPDCIMHDSGCQINRNALDGYANREKGKPITELQVHCMRAYNGQGKKVA